MVLIVLFISPYVLEEQKERESFRFIYNGILYILHFWMKIQNNVIDIVSIAPLAV